MTDLQGALNAANRGKAKITLSALSCSLLALSCLHERTLTPLTAAVLHTAQAQLSGVHLHLAYSI